MALPSPSSHDRVDLCGGSAALPQVRVIDELWPERGHVLHKYLAEVPVLGREAALELVPMDFRESAEVIDLSRLPACEPESYAAELWIGFHVETGAAREIGRGITRDQARALARPGEMVGGIDTLGLTADAVMVGDYKTGWKRLAPVAQLRQLRAYALFAARLFGRTKALVATIRIREDGSPWFDRAEFDAFELAVIEQEITDLVEKVRREREKVARGELPELVEGDHCQHCPAFTICPAKMALVRSFASAPETAEGLIAEATPAQLATAWGRVQAAEKVIERVKTTIQNLARETPIPLGDGTVLGKVAMEELDPEATEDVLRIVYGDEFAAAAVRSAKATSKKAVGEALRRFVLKPGMKITHLEQNALEALRAAGAVKVSHQIRKHKPKDELPADAGGKAAP